MIQRTYTGNGQPARRRPLSPLDIVKGERDRAQYEAKTAFYIEQRYLAMLKALVARAPGQTVTLTDQEVMAAGDLRLGIAPHGEQCGALLTVRRGADVDREDLPGMDDRMVERGAV